MTTTIANKFLTQREEDLLYEGYRLKGVRSAASDGVEPSKMRKRDIIRLCAETLFFLEQYRSLQRQGRDPQIVMGFAFTERLYALPEAA